MAVKILPTFYSRTDNPRTRVVLRQVFYLGCVGLHLQVSLSPESEPKTNDKDDVERLDTEIPLERTKGIMKCAPVGWLRPFELDQNRYDWALSMMPTQADGVGNDGHREGERDSGGGYKTRYDSYEGEGDNGYVNISVTSLLSTQTNRLSE